MVIRSKHVIFKPKAFIVDLSLTEARHVKQSLGHEGWKQSMEDEYSAKIKNNTWSLVPHLLGRKTVGSKWVWRVKKLKTGLLDKQKSHFMAQGFHQ